MAEISKGESDSHKNTVLATRTCLETNRLVVMSSMVG